jgi:hypothetical protein
MKTILTTLVLGLMAVSNVALAQEAPSSSPRAFIMVPGEYKGQPQSDARQHPHHRQGHDIDKDGIPNRQDRDIDGDGVRNRFDRDANGDGMRDRRPLGPKDELHAFKRIQQESIQTLNARIEMLGSVKNCVAKAKSMAQLKGCDVNAPLSGKHLMR